MKQIRQIRVEKRLPIDATWDAQIEDDLKSVEAKQMER